MKKVPKRVKDSAIKKWQGGLDSCGSMGEFLLWWRNKGDVLCSYCKHYNKKDNFIGPLFGRKDQCICPLWEEGESDVCAPEWDKLRTIVVLRENVTLDKIRELVKAMFKRIEES